MTGKPAQSSPRLRAVIFDLGDTLVKCYGNWPELLQRAVDLCYEYLSRTRPDLSRDALLHVAEQAVGSQAHALTAENRAFPARERVVAVLHALGIEPEPQLLGELVARLYEPVSACSRPLPAARELLRELKRAGLRLGLISNTPWDVPGHLVQRDLARFGLDEYFDTRVFSDRGHRKPHPELFRRALAALGTSPADTIMVGDSLPEDVAGAKTAGMRTLWVGAERELAVRDGSDVTPDYVAEDLPAAGRILLGLVAKS